MTKEPCQPNGNVGGVSLREYIELLVKAEVNEIKVLLAERLEAVHTAYERHEAEHLVIRKDMEHLNELRQEVVGDRDRFVLKETFRELRGQMFGAIGVLGLAFAIVSFVIAYYK